MGRLAAQMQWMLVVSFREAKTQQEGAQIIKTDIRIGGTSQYS